MDKLFEAITMAVEGHATQVDLAGRPYIEHLVRVAFRVPVEYAAVALLHDYFEDVIPVGSVEELAESVPFLSSEEHVALWLLTRKDGQIYRDYVKELKPHRIARAVKLADLNDHLYMSHKHPIPDSLYTRYIEALITLREQ